VIVNIGKDKNSSISNFFVLLLMFFVIVFPKGGIKYHSIPITWGYSLLAIISLALLIRKKYLIRKDHIYILISLLPFQIYSIILISVNGILSLGFTISFFVGFFALPFIFFFIFSGYIQNLDIDFFIKIFKRSILFIASYGIFLFFYKIYYGSIFEIPFLSINYHERGLIENMKFIDRGTVFKLISTYNNGNLYGICILMFMPLYNYLEKNHLKKSIVKFSLILTLSRTVWVGLIISEFLYDLFIKKNKSLSLIKLLISSSLIISFIVIIGHIFDFPLHWFFDKTLGNRVIEENYFVVTLFSSLPFRYIQEMLYVGILKNFGIFGIIFFIIGIFSPICIFTIKHLKKKSLVFNKCICLGLITYLIISFSDSAILYIPILAFYWFLSALLLINIKETSKHFHETSPLLE